MLEGIGISDTSLMRDFLQELKENPMHPGCLTGYDIKYFGKLWHLINFEALNYFRKFIFFVYSFITKNMQHIKLQWHVQYAPEINRGKTKLPLECNDDSIR